MAFWRRFLEVESASSSMTAPLASYGYLTHANQSITLRVRLDNRPGTLARLTAAIGEAGGNIINMTMAHRQLSAWEIQAA